MQDHIAKLLAFRIYRFRDTAAYAELYREYEDAIYRFVARKVGRPEDVEEIVSDSFLRGWEYMTANLVDNPRALLYKVAQNMIADLYRSGKQAEQLSDEMAERIPASASLLGDVETNEAVKEILAAIRQLKAEYQEVLLMLFVEQRTAHEIAGELGKSVSSVYVLIYRAKHALKKHL